MVVSIMILRVYAAQLSNALGCEEGVLRTGPFTPTTEWICITKSY